MATEFDPIWAESYRAPRACDEPRRWPPLASVGVAGATSAILWVLIIRAAMALF